MNAWERYAAWGQKCREPARLDPIKRFWLGQTFQFSGIHIGLNLARALPEDRSLLLFYFVAFAAPLLGMIFAPVLFQRLVGETNLEQPKGHGFKAPYITRVALIFAIALWFLFLSVSAFNPVQFIESPAALLLGGLIFELTLGRLPWLKLPIKSASTTREESA